MQKIIQDMSEISRCGILFRKAQLESLGISNRHATYLLRICKAPGITQEQLTRQIHVDKSNVARQVACLEEAGLVERKASPEDKRAFQLFPTEMALAILPRITEVFSDWEDYLTQALTPEEKKLFGALVERIKTRACQRLEVQSLE